MKIYEIFFYLCKMMYYRMIFRISLLLVVLLASGSFSGCRDRCACETMEEAPQAFLDYWYFPTGSWWVYALKDSAGVYDTVRVIEQSANDNDYCTAKGTFEPPCIKMYGTKLIHSNKIYFKNNNSNSIDLIGSSYIQNKWNISKISEITNLYGNEIYFQYPFEINSPFLSKSIPVSLDTLILNSSEIILAVHINLFMSSSADSINDRGWMKEVWFAPGIGMVKTRYTFNQVWELVDYHIEK